jgi:uncharacterized protein (DUF433 family)
MGIERITYEQGILGRKPIIKGTRITVSLILNLLAQGMKEEEILREYPHLQRADIYAALEYASKMVENEEIVLAEAV